MDPSGPSDVAEGADSAEVVDLSHNESGDLSPGPSHPAVKRLKRAHAQSLGSPSRGGRPPSTLWDLIDKSGKKQNLSHFTAYCLSCMNFGIQPKGSLARLKT